MELATVKAQNGKISFPYIPVAVFIGGTSGIGRATAEALARYTNGNTNIIIVGRNRAAADSIIASFPRPSFPSVKHEFIQCDVTLLKNVRQTTNEILSRHSKINLLVISTGEMELFNREITEDGLDRIVVLAYYSRWKFIHGLMPALAKAKEANEDAKVLSVASAGLGGKVDLEDLELKKVSLIPFLRSISTYNDLMVEVSYIYILSPRLYIRAHYSPLGLCFTLSLDHFHTLQPWEGSHSFRIKFFLNTLSNAVFPHQLPV